MAPDFSHLLRHPTAVDNFFSLKSNYTPLAKENHLHFLAFVSTETLARFSTFDEFVFKRIFCCCTEGPMNNG
jgi:hypothetical protein